MALTALAANPGTSPVATWPDPPAAAADALPANEAHAHPAAPPAGDPMAQLGLHQDVQQRAQAGRPAEHVLYSAQPGAGKGAAQAAAVQPTQMDVHAGYKQLMELVRKVDPKGPEAEHLIEVLHAYALQHPGAMELFIRQADPELVALLGPYGYAGFESVGRLATARFEYALGNFHRLSPDERYVAVHFGHVEGVAQKFGISWRLSYNELQARDALVDTRRLPDGTKHTGTGDEYRAASRANINNHALSHLAQIRSCGPLSLIGRLFGGEQGAAVGAAFDALAPAAVAASSRAAGQGTPAPSSGRDQRPLAAERRLPPVREPADAPRDVLSKTIAMDRTQPRIGAVTQPGGGAGHASTEPGNASVAAARRPPAAREPADAAVSAPPKTIAMANTRPGMGVPVTRPGAGAGHASTEPGNAPAAAAAANPAAAAAGPARPTLPGTQPASARADRGAATLAPANQPMTPDQAIEGLRHGWPTVASMGPGRHAQMWQDLGGQGPAPVVYREGQTVRIDWDRLTPEQQRRFQVAATEAILGPRP